MIDFNLPSKIPVLLASGCVLIGSVPESGTAAQAIRESGGGVVIPPEDAVALARQIEEFYHNPELVGQMSMAGRKYAETHYSFQGATRTL